jgi:hypothetical protein
MLWRQRGHAATKASIPLLTSQAAISQKLASAAMSKIATGASAIAMGRARAASFNFVAGFNVIDR